MRHPIGSKVRVISATDETCNLNYIGLTGTVISYNDNGATGNTVGDPLHVVLFENVSNIPDDHTGQKRSVIADHNYGGVTIFGKHRKEDFWYEELEPIN